MLESMSVRCTECGYENRDPYRYCGRCGKPLQPLEPAAAPSESAPPTVGGPSFLGLTEEPKRNLDYLLEDEPHSHHGRMYVALALLVAAGLFIGWRWHREGYPWAERSATPPAASDTTSPSPTAPLGPSASESASSQARPAAPQNPGESHTIQEDEQKSNVADKTKGEPKETQAATQQVQGAPQQTTPAPAASSSAATVPQSKTPELAQPEPTSNTENDDAALKPESRSAATGTSPEVADNPETPAAPAAKPPKSAAPSGTYEDKLAAEGEKYLYGDGVPENCARAQKKLTAAAKSSNVKAQSLLGTMYATGHCVSRDLPTAYRWFAKALHQDPSNARVQQDLEVLWRQMTPDERQAALRN
jgi:TPR repeat protein